MNNYPENDYRNYLMHWGKGEESQNHKYLSRKMGSNGKWIYTYASGSKNPVAKLMAERSRKKALKDARRDIAGTYYQSFNAKTGSEQHQELQERYAKNRENRSVRRQQKAAARSLKRKHTINKVKSVLGRAFN